MAWVESDPESLSRELLHRALFARGAGERRCVDCRRVPLTGEQVHVYEDGRMICTLCRPNRREEPIRVERVPGVERGHAVRPTTRAARAA